MFKTSGRSLKRAVALGVAALLFLAASVEVGLRLAGALDFPVYDVDAQIGYIPAPHQNGAFLNRNHWLVNGRSMGSPAWAPRGDTDLLLLGDSLVWGGNSLDHDEKLGPQLQRRLPAMQVWSAGAGSWSVLNQLAYLDRYPDVEKESDTVVWILNSDDLPDVHSRWTSDLTHPRGKPASALWYLASKFLLKKQEGTSTESDPMDVQSISQAAVQVFEARLNELSRSKRVLVVLYPTKKEALAPSPRYLAFRQAARSAMNGCCRWLEVRERAEWSAGHYRDSIHPSAHGNRVLADLIGNALHEAAL